MSEQPALHRAKKAIGRTANWAAGWRTIGGRRVYFRSIWEANWARYLQHMVETKRIAGWEHEPKTFWFEGIKRGVVSYKPDFRVTHIDGSHVWHEVKGWMDHRSKLALKRFARHYPDERIDVIDAASYKKVHNFGRVRIPDWETDKPPAIVEAPIESQLPRRIR